MVTPVVAVCKNDETNWAENERVDGHERKLDSHGASNSCIISGSRVKTGGILRKPDDVVGDHPVPSRHHVVYCFDLLLAHFHNLGEPTPNFHLDYVCPIFVTWDKVLRKGKKQLRGCIGTLKPRPISFLRDYCHSSAFKDRRFSPIELLELPELQCSVSFLVRFEKVKSYTDWEVGRHGIIINFSVDLDGKQYGATYLPYVAIEQGQYYKLLSTYYIFQMDALSCDLSSFLVLRLDPKTGCYITYPKGGLLW
eukprot:50625_1